MGWLLCRAGYAISLHPLLCLSPKGFLIESKLLRSLQALGRHERTLMKLDSIFAVSCALAHQGL